jgi:hypothetical protein
MPPEVIPGVEFHELFNPTFSKRIAEAVMIHLRKVLATL